MRTHVGSFVITCCAGVLCASFPTATTRRAMSLSVRIPANVPSRWITSAESVRVSASIADNSAMLVSVSRSEEHTSELQSLMRISYAVFCLKNKKLNTTSNTLIYNMYVTEYTNTTHQTYSIQT